MSDEKEKIEKYSQLIEELEGVVIIQKGDDKRYAIGRIKHLYHARGDIFMKDGNHDKAIADYKRAAELEGADFWDFHTLGDAYFKNHDYNEAEELYLQAQSNLEKEKDEKEKQTLDGISQFALANCYSHRGLYKCKNGDWTSAFMDFERAYSKEEDIFWSLLSQNPENVMTHILYALINIKKVLVSNDKILGGDGAGPEVSGFFLRGWINLDTLVKTIAADPHNALTFLKAWHSQNHNYRAGILLEAIAIYEDGNKEESRQSVAYLIHSGSNNLEQSEQILVFLYALSTDHPIGIWGMGYYYVKHGALLKGLKIYDDMLTVYPNHPWAQLGIEEALKLAPDAIERHIEKGESQESDVLLKRLGNFGSLAEWYDSTARDAEDKGAIQSAIEYYRGAVRNYERDGNKKRAAECHQNMRRLLRQSELQATLDSPPKMFLGEWDSLSIEIANYGFGPARNIAITIEGPVTIHDVEGIHEIPAGEKGKIMIVLRPNEAGRSVPLSFHITYEDSKGKQEMPRFSKLFKVARPEKRETNKTKKKRK